MAKIASFRELIVWQKAMDLAEGVHRATAELPRTELFGIGTQLRRAAVSIPANVAEGFARHSRLAYRSHVAIALGSQAEVQTHLELCRRLMLMPPAVIGGFENLADEIGRMLSGLWRGLTAAVVCYPVVVLIVAVSWGLWPESFGFLLRPAVLGLFLGPGA